MMPIAQCPIGSQVRSFCESTALIAVLLCGCPSPAAAYNLYSFKWSQPSTTFYVAIPGADNVWNEAFESAMSSWQVGTVFRFNIVRNVYEDPCDDIDNRNGVGFGDTNCGDAWGSTTLAITQSWYNPGTSATIQTDIVFNNTLSWNVYSTSWQAPPWIGVNDFKRVAVHELGHVLSLNHENSGVPSIMRSYVGNITLPQQDDINGIGALYGFPVADADGDGVADSADNCPTIANAGQADSDTDGIGDACDSCPTDPSKKVPGICGCNMPEVSTDADHDGILDCLDGGDSDRDGYTDKQEIRCGSNPADQKSICGNGTSIAPIIMLLLKE